MRKTAVKIPNDAFDRTVEYLEGSPGLWLVKLKVHAYMKCLQLLSHVTPAYHFDSIKEFLDYQENFQAGFHSVTLPEVKVASVSDRNETLEIILEDNTGRAELIHEYKPELVGGHKMPVDHMNNPLLGAIVGDTLQIFCSRYNGNNCILVLSPWYVKNDDHYARVRKRLHGFDRRSDDR